MSLPCYEVPMDWVPSVKFINAPSGSEYIAWRLGTNERANLALWAIDKIVTTPTTPLVDLLPDTYTSITVDTDVVAWGYKRTVMPGDTIADVEAAFYELIDGIIAGNIQHYL